MVNGIKELLQSRTKQKFFSMYYTCFSVSPGSASHARVMKSGNRFHDIPKGFTTQNKFLAQVCKVNY